MRSIVITCGQMILVDVSTCHSAQQAGWHVDPYVLCQLQNLWGVPYVSDQGRVIGWIAPNAPSNCITRSICNITSLDHLKFVRWVIFSQFLLAQLPHSWIAHSSQVLVNLTDSMSGSPKVVFHSVSWCVPITIRLLNLQFSPNCCKRWRYNLWFITTFTFTALGV